MSKIQPVRGTHDFFADSMDGYRTVVDAFETIAALHGYKPVATPVFEFTELFARGIGETTDVVSKEMYSFADRGGESLTLRPEFTAGLCRAYVANGWQQLAPVKLAAHGPLFRYERPQKGRFRQFHQIDAEVIGAAEPIADVELIAMAHGLLMSLGIDDKVTLTLNTLGDAASRAAYRDALVAYFSDHAEALSADSKTRLAKNPLRILDSKDAGDQALVAAAPTIDAYLTPEAAHFFAQVCEGLDALSIPYTRNPRLVRGLDYYCHTAFEFVTDALGAQGTVIGGGRYDGLVEQLGGPPTPAVGWAGGIERLAMLLDDVESGPQVDVAVIPLGEGATWPALAITQALRASGIVTDQAYRGNAKKRFQKADAAKAALAVVIGEDELAKGVVQIKLLGSGEQIEVPIPDIIDKVEDLLTDLLGDDAQ
jgi:histidyl-tRNA synthetase